VILVLSSVKNLRVTSVIGSGKNVFLLWNRLFVCFALPRWPYLKDLIV